MCTHPLSLHDVKSAPHKSINIWAKPQLSSVSSASRPFWWVSSSLKLCWGKNDVVVSSFANWTSNHTTKTLWVNPSIDSDKAYIYLMDAGNDGFWLLYHVMQTLQSLISLCLLLPLLIWHIKLNNVTRYCLSGISAPSPQVVITALFRILIQQTRLVPVLPSWTTWIKVTAPIVDCNRSVCSSRLTFNGEKTNTKTNYDAYVITTFSSI